MSMAWETTDDDVREVLRRRLGRRPTDEEVEKAFDFFVDEDGRITKAALRGDVLSDQLSYALAEMGDILDEIDLEGILSGVIVE